MGAPLKPRARRKPKYTRTDASERNKAMWRDHREVMLARVKTAGRPMGVADGHTKEQIAALRPQAEAKAERIIRAMAKDDFDIELYDVSLSPEEMELLEAVKVRDEAETLVDDEKAVARRALKEAITIALMPGNRQTKLAALRTVLEYTKAKPASTTNTNINAAEAFLEALAKKE